LRSSTFSLGYSPKRRSPSGGSSATTTKALRDRCAGCC
jgi:hypothetical protein